MIYSSPPLTVHVLLRSFKCCCIETGRPLTRILCAFLSQVITALSALSILIHTAPVLQHVLFPGLLGAVVTRAGGQRPELWARREDGKGSIAWMASSRIVCRRQAWADSRGSPSLHPSSNCQQKARTRLINCHSWPRHLAWLQLATLEKRGGCGMCRCFEFGCII